jgi:hypothetical protein
MDGKKKAVLLPGVVVRRGVDLLEPFRGWIGVGWS